MGDLLWPAPVKSIWVALKTFLKCMGSADNEIVCKRPKNLKKKNKVCKEGCIHIKTILPGTPYPWPQKCDDAKGR